MKFIALTLSAEPTYLADTSEHQWRTTSAVISHQSKSGSENRISPNRSNFFPFPAHSVIY